MGDTVMIVVLSPAVTADSVERLAIELRRRASPPRVFTLCTLEGVRTRQSRVKTLRDLGVRILKPDEPFGDVSVLEESLGSGTFLYRYDNTDEVNICIPDRRWMKQTFGTRDADWLLDPMDITDVPWRRENYHAVPGNPSSWSVKAPFFARLLGLVWKPGMDWECPLCGVHFSPRRAMFQCRNYDCSFAIQLFGSYDEAFSLDEVPLDGTNWGRCNRCRRARYFAFEIEHCFRCGQLLSARPQPDARVALQANRTQAIALISAFRRHRQLGEPLPDVAGI